MALKSSKFNQDDYEILNREVLYAGIFRMVRYELRYRKFNNTWSDTISRELMERKSAVAVLPYDPIQDKVVLIEQFRPGAIANPKNPWLLEIVAGLYETDERPDQVAIREAQEEAGCKVKELIEICHYFVSPGGMNEEVTLFCGIVEINAEDGIFGLVDEHEDIHAFAVPFTEAYAMLQQGLIKTSPAIIGLQWLQLYRDSIKDKWQKN